MWVRLHTKKKRDKPNMRAKDFLEYRQTNLLKDRDVKPWFAYAFLKSLGWMCKAHVRSTYYGGHERPDVVARG